MVLLIDAKYFGTMLQAARRNQGIKANDMAQMLKISVRQLHHYERGTEPIPENILMSLFYNGLCLLRCKRQSRS